MPMWHDHLQLSLWLQWVVTYDKELGCMHMEKHCALYLDKDCPIDDVHMAIHIFLFFIITNSIIMTTI